MSIRRLVFYLSMTFLVLALAGIPFRSELTANNSSALGLIAGRNVNMVSGTTWPGGDPWLQRQNEPSVAVSTRNPLHLLAGANDYRTINIPFADEIPGQNATSYVKDAWLGKYTSIDGAQTWKSTLLPGYPQDESAQGLASPIYGLGAAADPVVRSGPNGLFYYAGIAFNRLDRGSGVLFVSRFIDNNYKENVDTIDYIDTKIIDRGTSGQFIDKPWIAVDLPTDSSTIDFPAPPDPLTGAPQVQKVARHNVYAAYSVFLGNDINVRSKILFSRSTDNGATWSTPIKLTESQHICQGATIAVDPRGNGTIYVAWRRFGTPSQADAIVIVKSVNWGLTFTKPIVVYQFAASTIQQPSKNGVFDQITTTDSFRTNDYPTMAVDNSGRAFIVWSQRGFGPTSTPPALGESRLMISASYDYGLTWTVPLEAIGAIPDETRPGHQFMPSLTYAAGKLTLLWYDQRWDLCGAFEDPFIRDIYMQRHTIDVRVSQLPVDNGFGGSLVFLNSIQVSRYPFVLIPDDPDNPSIWYAVQLLHNMPNLQMFQLGSVPFMGDYIDIAASPQYIYNGSKWIYNTNPNTPTVYHAVWTDNRDVLPAGEDFEYADWSSGNFPSYNAPDSSCTEATKTKTGLLNQNIYTSRISKGIIAGSPGNAKLLNFLRSFVVFVKNTMGTERDFTLSIVSGGATAYFYDQADPTNESLTSVVVTAYPYSYVQKTVLVKNTGGQYASIKVNVFENGSLISTITLNPDPTNPPIDESEGVDPGSPHIRNEGETHTPHIRNYMIADWSYDDVNPNITTVYPQSDEDNVNTDGVTPYTVEGDAQSPHIRNPHIRNNVVTPHIRNNIINPHIRNESFGDNGVIPDDSHLTDIYWTIDNSGNTTSSFNINTFETPTDIPDGVMVQMIIFKTYSTPTAEGCNLVEEEHQEVILNYETPHIRNVSLLPEMTVDLKPNEKCHVLYRFYNPNDTLEQQDYYENREEYLGDTVPDIESEIPNTDPEDPDKLLPKPQAPLVIPPQILLDGAVGEIYQVTLQAIGGTEPYAWSLVQGEVLPPGLTLDSTGSIHGTLSTGGTYAFNAQVVDSSSPAQTSARQFVINVDYVISASAGSGGTISPSGQIKVAKGANQAFSIAADAGHVVLDVIVDEVSQGPITAYTFEDVNDNHTITAEFAMTAVLTIGKTGTGTGTVTSTPAGISCGSDCTETFAVGTPLTLSAIGDPGSTFFEWTGDVPPGKNYDNPLNFQIPANASITARFTVDMFATVTDPSGDAGSDPRAPISPDLISASASVQGRFLNLSVRLANETFNSQTSMVTLVLDTDQNINTGYPGIDAAHNDSSIIGAEYNIEMGSTCHQNKVAIYQWDPNTQWWILIANNITVTFQTDGIDAAIPLDLLGNDDGKMDFKALVQYEISNCVWTGILDYITSIGLPAGRIQ